MSTKTLTFLATLCLCTGNAASQVAVIANKSVPIDEVKQAELLDYYTGDIRRWNDKLPVVVFDLKPKEEIKESFYKYLGKSTSRMKSIWMKNLLAGEGEPPEALESEDEILAKVASTPGGIGFVRKEKVDKNVKVLLVIESESDEKGQ